MALPATNEYDVEVASGVWRVLNDFPMFEKKVKDAKNMKQKIPYYFW